MLIGPVYRKRIISYVAFGSSDFYSIEICVASANALK